MTDPLGQSQVIPYVKGLSKKGYKFTLLSCEKKERFDKFHKEIEEILAESNIEWVPIPYHKKPPVLSTVFDFFLLKSKAIEIHKNRKFKLLHCRSYISSLIGLYFKKRFEVPFIFDMRGFWADERVDGGLWNLKNPIYNSVYKFFKKKEQAFLADCAAAISLTKAGKIEMEKWEVCINNKTPIHVIPCSADFDFFKVSEHSVKIKNRLLLGFSENDFVVSYLGSLGTWYMLEEMLDLLKVLAEKFRNVKFLIITPDSPTVIIDAVERKKMDAGKFTIQYAQRKDIVEKLSVSDLSIFFIKPLYSKISSSPTKLGELFAMGIPVMCNDRVGDVEEIVSNVEAGFIIKEFSQDEYNKAVEKIPDLLKLDPAKIRQQSMSYYSLKNAVDKYAEIYSDILS